MVTKVLFIWLYKHHTSTSMNKRITFTDILIKTVLFGVLTILKTVGNNSWFLLYFLLSRLNFRWRDWWRSEDLNYTGYNENRGRNRSTVIEQHLDVFKFKKVDKVLQCYLITEKFTQTVKTQTVN